MHSETHALLYGTNPLNRQKLDSKKLLGISRPSLPLLRGCSWPCPRQRPCRPFRCPGWRPSVARQAMSGRRGQRRPFSIVLSGEGPRRNLPLAFTWALGFLLSIGYVGEQAG